MQLKVLQDDKAKGKYSIKAQNAVHEHVSDFVFISIANLNTGQERQLFRSCETGDKV